jgi:hypothetical protein
MNSVIEVFKNKRLEKTGDYWYDGDNRVYFTNIKLVNAGGTNTVTLTAKPDYEQLGNQDFSYEIKKYVDVRIGCVNLDDLRQIIFSTNSFPITYIDEETHDGFAAYQDDFYVVDTDDSIPIIKNISKPSITVDDNNLYITIMMQDYYYNYYYSVLRYKIGTNNILTKLSSKTYRPEYIKLTDYLTFDSSQASMDYTNYILATSKIDTNLVYRKKVDNTIDVSYTIEKPTYSERIATYYDNDELEVVSRTLPILQYSLGDFYNVAPDAFIAEEEATYNYTIGTLYAPSDITLNYQQLSGYSNIINTEKIFKVIYRLGGEIISQDITDGSNSSSYDSTFNRSPVNNPPLVKTIELSENSNYGSFSYNIELYSVSGFRYVFAIDFYATNININEQFAKVELLDARVQKTDTGNNMVVYLNTREPNYITSVSLINI